MKIYGDGDYEHQCKKRRILGFVLLVLGSFCSLSALVPLALRMYPKPEPAGQIALAILFLLPGLILLLTKPND